MVIFLVLRVTRSFPSCALFSVRLVMEKNIASRPFSSQVRGWLTIEGIQHELSQVGPGFCIVREPLTVEWSNGSEQRADLTIEVDGEQRCVAVVLCGESQSRPKYLYFRKVSLG